jgi:hypothetical protein
MGYDLHIQRDRGREISLEEWEAYIERSDDLILQPFIEHTNPVTGDVMSMEAPGMAGWTAHPDGRWVIFDHRGSGIAHKQPDEPTLARMHEIAAAFGARIHGDDGEFYDLPKPKRRLFGRS